MRVTKEITNRTTVGQTFHAESGPETVRPDETREIAVPADDPTLKAAIGAGNVAVKWQAHTRKADEPSLSAKPAADKAGA